MPQFAVYYSFTCPKCGHKNAERETVVSAQNKDAAAQMAYAKAQCLKCSNFLPSKTNVTMHVRKL